jgi:hypothetical protein
MKAIVNPTRGGRGHKKLPVDEVERTNDCWHPKNGDVRVLVRAWMEKIFHRHVMRKARFSGCREYARAEGPNDRQGNRRSCGSLEIVIGINFLARSST